MRGASNWLVLAVLGPLSLLAAGTARSEAGVVRDTARATGTAAGPGCTWNVKAPVVKAKPTPPPPQEIAATASWLCQRYPRSFNFKVELEVFQPQRQRWLPHSDEFISSKQWTLQHWHSITATSSLPPEQFRYRTRAWMTINGQTEQKTSSAVTLP